MATSAGLARRLGTTDAVLIGLGSMIGAGVFAVFAPAAHAAGRWLLAAPAVAAVVAYCNATSSARLAARYPSSGGTYVYGRERLGEFWGYLAGWAFVVGKTASCAAMALTFAAYAAPGYDLHGHLARGAGMDPDFLPHAADRFSRATPPAPHQEPASASPWQTRSSPPTTVNCASAHAACTTAALNSSTSAAPIPTPAPPSPSSCPDQ